MVTHRGVRIPVPTVLGNGEKIEQALTPMQMTTNFQTHQWAASMEDRQPTIHSFRIGGAAGHSMDSTPSTSCMEYVGWKFVIISRRYVGLRVSAAATGAKRARETALIEADALPLSAQFALAHAASHGIIAVGPIRGSVEVWVYTDE